MRKTKEQPILENVLITDIGAEGKAIARIDGMVLFVPFVVPGDIADINAVINIILGGNGDYTKADVNGDHEVNIADVNTIINIILSH